MISAKKSFVGLRTLACLVVASLPLVLGACAMETTTTSEELGQKQPASRLATLSGSTANNGTASAAGADPTQPGSGTESPQPNPWLGNGVTSNTPGAPSPEPSPQPNPWANGSGSTPAPSSSAGTPTN